MKTLLLSTVAALALSSVANATDFACGSSQFLVGKQSVDPQDTVNRIEVRHSSNSPEWLVNHRFVNGTMVMRQEQYAMVDTSRNGYWSWRGQLRKNGAIAMIGELRRDAQGQTFYVETQYDRGQITMKTVSACSVMTAVASPGPYRPLDPPVAAPVRPLPVPPLPPVAAPVPAPTPQPPIIINNNITPPAPPPVAAPEPPKAEPPKPVETPKPTAERIPISIVNDSARLDVGLGSRTVTKTVDTGATQSVITNEVAELLVRDGQARWRGTNQFKMADGSIKTLQTVTIKEVRIGRHVVRDVLASVSENGMMLLGFPVLRTIGRSFTIDTHNRELVFTNIIEDQPPPKQADADPFWPEGTKISDDCGKQIAETQDPKTGLVPDDLKEKVDAECYANMERWGKQLAKNLNDPAFKKRIMDVFDQAAR